MAIVPHMLMFLASAFAMSLGVSARGRAETYPKNVFYFSTDTSKKSASRITYNKYIAYAYESAYTFGWLYPGPG